MSLPTEGKRVRAAARTWFLGPPRRHGEQLTDRSVGNLELFYDLVFVVFISRIAATLAEHVSVRTTLDYVVLFSLLWVVWFNGSLYHELLRTGRPQPGRRRRRGPFGRLGTPRAVAVGARKPRAAHRRLVARFARLVARGVRRTTTVRRQR